MNDYTKRNILSSLSTNSNSRTVHSTPIQKTQAYNNSSNNDLYTNQANGTTKTPISARSVNPSFTQNYKTHSSQSQSHLHHTDDRDRRFSPLHSHSNETQPQQEDVYATQPDSEALVSSFSELSTSEREVVIVEDLLFALIGISGKYIHAKLPNERSNKLKERDGHKYSTAIDTYHSNSTPRLANFTTISSLSTIDDSIYSVMMLILRVADDYVSILKYTQVHKAHQFGRYQHALCAALNELLNDYLVLIVHLQSLHSPINIQENPFSRKNFGGEDSNLEIENRSVEDSSHRRLTLLQMHYYLQPATHTLTKLVTLCRSLSSSNALGGALLQSISTMISLDSDPVAQKLYSQVLRAASVPFFSTLYLWITRGLLYDPYNEFMIRERTDLMKETLNSKFNDTYWDERFSLRPELIPNQYLAEKSVSSAILQTGKYLNVIRECDDADAKNKPKTVAVDLVNQAAPFDWNEDINLLRPFVMKAYENASESLLKLLVVNHQFLARFETIKRFLLCEQGDLYVNFMSTAETELNKSLFECSQVGSKKVQALFDLAVRTSNVANDPFVDDVSCTFVTATLFQQRNIISESTSHQPNVDSFSSPMTSRNAPGSQNISQERKGFLTGWNGFVLSFNVPFPVSIVLSRTVLVKYYLLFRLLFACKYTARCLSQLWKLQKSTRIDNHLLLRQKMLHFTNSFNFYIFVEVIDNNTNAFLAALLSGSIRNVDELIQAHTSFLTSCLRQSLLSSEVLLRQFLNILATCQDYASSLQRWLSGTGEPDLNAARQEAMKMSGSDKDRNSYQALRKIRKRLADEELIRLMSSEKYINLIQKNTQRFDNQMTEFMRSLRERVNVHHENHFTQLLERLDFNGFYKTS